MQKAAIIGLGLMGGSLGLALKKARKDLPVAAFARRQETRDLAVRMGVVDEVYDSPGRAVKGADLVVFCVPVLSIPALVKECLGGFGEGCTLTDVGSTKSLLVREVETILKGSPACYVGSHPMAGSEEAGITSARADLYQKAVVIVTPGAAPEETAVRKVVSMWKLVGSEIGIMEPATHDAVIARTSHLPHIIASVLVKSVLGNDSAESARFCGAGFRDTTRIAAGSEDVWHDIIRSNSEAISAELDGFSRQLDHVRKMIAASDFEGVRVYLAETRRLRNDIKR